MSDYPALPPTLPIFPLPGALLLPHGRLPLNIFEPRYLNMVEDALGQSRLIGMIQPRLVQPDPVDSAAGLYDVGCVGRIITFSETHDGRFLITLAGMQRFRIAEEVPTTRGYRRIIADYQGFEADMAEDSSEIQDRDRLEAAMKAYFEAKAIEVDWESVSQADDESLITSLSMISPFDAPEKQALLESVSLQERAGLLCTLFEMDLHEPGGDDESDGEAPLH
ncbi:MAG: LON peptidase substrate-binding domain-containing protein [Magnetovibrionaceae bacterium]